MSVPPLFKIPKNILFSIGLPSAENTFYQLSEKKLDKQCLEKNKKILSKADELNANVKQSDKGLQIAFIVRGETTIKSIDRKKPKQSIASKHFDKLYKKMIDHLGKKEIWIRDSCFYIDSGQKLKIRHINEDARGNLFVLKAFSKPSKKELENFDPDWYFIHASTFLADTEKDGIDKKNFTIINFTKKVVLIGGVPFTKAIIEEIFSALNYEFKHHKT